MKIRILLASVIVPVTVAAVISGCGADLCVAGIGNCASLNKAFQNTTTTSSTGTLSVTLDKSPIQLGQVAHFIAGGGTAPYTYAVTTPAGFGSVDSTGAYTAPSAFPSGYSSPTGVTITATDTSNKIGTATVSVSN